MGRPAGWMKELTGCSAMKSPGKPSHRREVERWFWREIAKGLSSEDAAAAVRVLSAAGVRWFRERGGMATLLRDPVSCRYLCFAEREEIALLRAEGRGVREIARGGGGWRGAGARERRGAADARGGEAAQRAPAWRRAGEPGVGGAVEARPGGEPPERGHVRRRRPGAGRRPEATGVDGPA